MQSSHKVYNYLVWREKLELSPYRDQAGFLTYGYGHRLGLLDPVKDITADDAWQLLCEDVEKVEGQVNAALAGHAVTQTQYDALVCFCFNVGGHALAVSTLVAKLKRGDTVGAANEFLRWDHVRVGGQAVESNGLRRRCEEEREMFLGTGSEDWYH